MEIASGEYNVDVNKIVKIALKKYYEDTGRRIAEEHSFEEGESLQLLLFFCCSTTTFIINQRPFNRLTHLNTRLARVALSSIGSIVFGFVIN